MKSIVSVLSRYMLTLCFSSIMIFGGLTVYFMVTDYRKELQKVDERIMRGLEDSLLREASRLQNFIEFSRNNAQMQGVKNIRNFILEAHNLSEILYNRYKDSMPGEDLKTLIRETLRSMIHHYTDSYIFIVDMNGIEQLHTDRPEMEQKDLSMLQSTDGRFVVKDMISMVRDQGEGYIDYLWTKPGAEGSGHEKKSFLKLFKPYQWIIGTGAYYATIKEQTQKEVLNRLSTLNPGKDGFIFAGTYSGVPLLGPGLDRRELNIADAGGSNPVQHFVTLAKSGGGFLTYKTISGDSRHDSHKVLSYCTAVPEWQWYIGSGIDISMVEKKLSAEKDNLLTTMILKISSVSALLLIYSIATIFFSERFRRMISDNFNSFDRFFRKGMEAPVKIDRSQIAFKEFDQMAQLANSMIDSREEARQNLLKSEITYREIFNSTKDAIAVMDIEKRIFTDVNQAFLDFFGMDRSDAVGMSPEDISFNTPPYDNRYAAELFKKAQSGETVHFEWMVKKANGEPFWTDNLARVATIGAQKKILIVMRDVTERKKMHRIMIQTEKMMSIGGLAAGMAHEINNPLGVIMQVCQNIIRRTSPNLKSNQPVAEQCGVDLDNLRNYMEKRGITNYLHAIQDAGMRAATIVKSMLDFSRKSSSAKSSCNIESVIETAISLASNDYNLKKQYDFKKIKIIRDYSSPPMFNFTEMEISQVILNLIKNAAEALSEENNTGKVPTITIRTSTDKQSVRVEIEDNGPGIPAETLARVFEPFYSTKSPGLGTGLGLSVSYFIVTHNHGGTITADSNTGEGTRFTVTLPML
ncbi:cache domain-containing protein [Maridesulfovibrio sp. FT414]|uniref:cache domain-containing protein n=1 Tax=Maridesulfovibrio sp. FT414 TaxID=2979469 RepID=UPI003D8091D6